MVLPQRGQMEPLEAQVVPQWEQVLTRHELHEEHFPVLPDDDPGGQP